MSKCWYCNEELTTANYCEDHMGICTKCYNSMFKVGNDFVKSLTDKITDLEAKLAEKQSKIQELNDLYEDLLVAKGTENELMQVSADCDFFAKENRKLKQQLAEKEKEILDVKNWWSYQYEGEKQRHHQDKISFCIEQLEKAKGKIQHNILFVNCDDYVNVIEEIDNQIEELKKEMK